MRQNLAVLEYNIEDVGLSLILLCGDDEFKIENRKALCLGSRYLIYLLRLGRYDDSECVNVL